MKEDKKPLNPSAFPNDIHESMNDSEYKHKGMTLRDYFAAKAMQGMIQDEKLREMFALKGNQSNTDWMDILSENSFYIADAMLKQREL